MLTAATIVEFTDPWGTRWLVHEEPGEPQLSGTTGGRQRPVIAVCA